MSNSHNNDRVYPLAARVFHWVTAVMVFSMFAFGLWMSGLNYSHRWYEKAPELHVSFGVLLLIIVIIRLIYRCLNSLPAPLPSHGKTTVFLSKMIAFVSYSLIFLIVLAGYLLVTADGRSLSFFGLFTIPALFPEIEYMEDYAGSAHEIMAKLLVFLGLGHGVMALKHHFFDKDNTLRRMLG